MIAGLLFACKRNVLDPVYKGKNQLVIGSDFSQNTAADSVIFSFAELENNVKEGNIIVNVQISGQISDKDRSFKLEANAAGTTALPEEYEIPQSVVVPAGAVRTTIYLKVKRTARLTGTLAKLRLQVVGNENFEPGVVTQVGTFIASNMPQFMVNYGPAFDFLWTDMLTKPPTWDAAGYGFSFAVGNWSKVKHQLIIDATGTRSFMSATSPEKYALAAKAARFLADYNTAHPGAPLRNEDGIIISICSNCP